MIPPAIQAAGLGSLLVCSAASLCLGVVLTPSHQSKRRAILLKKAPSWRQSQADPNVPPHRMCSRMGIKKCRSKATDALRRRPHPQAKGRPRPSTSHGPMLRTRLKMYGLVIALALDPPFSGPWALAKDVSRASDIPSCQKSVCRDLEACLEGGTDGAKRLTRAVASREVERATDDEAKRCTPRSFEGACPVDRRDSADIPQGSGRRDSASR